MATQIWNNENARLKQEELYLLPDVERFQQAQLIRADLKVWAVQNFSFTPTQQECMNLLPSAYYDETGFLIARALEKQYPIDIWVTDDSTSAPKRKRGDSVEVGWSQKDGFNAKYQLKF